MMQTFLEFFMKFNSWLISQCKNQAKEECAHPMAGLAIDNSPEI